MRRSLPLAITLLALSSTATHAGIEPVSVPREMVTSTSVIASRVGLDVLHRGGNAIDAAVAVGLALAVTWPVAGNLGGGGFLLIRRADGKAEVIDFRETAPLAATRDMYLDGKGTPIVEMSTIGYRAVGVPGTVAGLALAQSRHGKLTWADVVRPARALAEEGFVLEAQGALMIASQQAQLAKFPDSARVFLPAGKPPRAGDRLVQKDLAATLARLEKDGPRDFYEGETARRIVSDMIANHGLVTAEDLRSYQPAVRAPLVGSYRGYEVITTPPPSSGGAILLEMLNMLDGFPVATTAQGSADAVHLLVEVMRRAFADRAAHMGDTDFVKVPVNGLIDKAYAASLARTIDRARATPSSSIHAGTPPPAKESHDTTHFNVVDKDGNAVSCTYTLNGRFGSGAVAAGTGVVLNNEMDDFTSKPGAPNMYGLMQGEANAIAPRKRPLSAMTPTMLVKDKKLVLTLGTPGGPTIITSVLQVIVNLIDFGMNLQQAIDAPRFHHQWMPDAIMTEPFGLNRDTRALLEQRGHTIMTRPPAPMYMGDVNAILVAPDGARLGACDPRFAGQPIGD